MRSLQTKKSLAVGLMLAVLLTGQQSRADTILQAIPFSATGPVGLDLFIVDPFDPSLGTLDRVDVSIDGVLQLSGQVLGLSPYIAIFNVDFTGLGGNFFDFSGLGLQFTYIGVEGYCAPVYPAGCSPIPGPIVQPPTMFSLDFYFDPFLESIGMNQAVLTGFSSVGGGVGAPPTTIDGAVSDFIEAPIQLDLMQLVSVQTGGNTLTASANISGAMFVTYNYTIGDAVSVPEPGTLALFGIGLFGMGLARRRKAV